MNLFIVTAIFSAELETDWVQVETYDDIRAGEQSRLGFQEQIIKTLNKHFITLANRLPVYHTLKLNVLNIDLAGEINYYGSRQVRTFKDLYFPRVSLSYQLLDESNQVIKSGTANIKNVNFMNSISQRYKNQFLGHEKAMIDKWFEEEFISKRITH